MIIQFENWCVRDWLPSPYAAPEQGVPRLCGVVVGHPHYEDGAQMSPSMPVAFNREHRIFRGYSGRYYKFGTVNPEWEKQYPNAEQRYFDQLESKTEKLLEDELELLTS